jgi:hypothetical protein
MPKNIYVTMDKILFNTIIPLLEEMDWDTQEDLNKAIDHLCEQLKERTKDVLSCDEDDDREQNY